MHTKITLSELGAWSDVSASGGVSRVLKGIDSDEIGAAVIVPEGLWRWRIRIRFNRHVSPGIVRHLFVFERFVHSLGRDAVMSITDAFLDDFFEVLK